jgi:hypothetical protein
MTRQMAPVFAKDISENRYCTSQPAPIDHSRISTRRLTSVATSTGTTSISTAKAPAAS